ncbi:MAG: hypothetical protein P1P64_09915 [Treponemataceae bacterium]
MQDHIHIVWYCISIANNRITSYDIENIKYFLSQNMKIAIVFTKCAQDDDNSTKANKIKDIISLEVKEQLDFFETCSDKSHNLPLNIEALIEWSIEKLPNEQLQRSFIISQIASLETKRKKAYKIVKANSTGAATTGGLNPFPISDSIILTGIQTTMCVEIANVFWMGTGALLNFKDLLKTQLLSMAGKSVVASLTKIIPGFGKIINATVAGTITYGFGVAITEANYYALKEFLETGETPDWAKIFTSEKFSAVVKASMDRRDN